MNTEKTWRETEEDLAETFGRWGIREWEATSNILRSRHTNRNLTRDERRATVKWKHKDGTPMVLTMDDHATPPDNLRVLYLGIEAMRMNQVRGIDKLLGQAYLQLAAPVTAVDPWQLLGLREDAPWSAARAVYRARVAEAHPDRNGGDGSAAAAINAAWDAIKGNWPEGRAGN